MEQNKADAVRIQTSVLNALEKKVLVWLDERQPQGASARWRSHRVAPEGAAGSRRERNSDLEVLHCR